MDDDRRRFAFTLLGLRTKGAIVFTTDEERSLRATPDGLRASLGRRRSS